MKFEQLPLTGTEQDFNNSIKLLKGYEDLVKALNKFFQENKRYNPRQLYYLVQTEALDVHLDKLIDWGGPIREIPKIP